MTLTLLLAALAAFIAPAAPGPLSQNQFERQVRRQLDAVSGEFRDRGYELTHQVFTGDLNEGRQQTVTFRLRRGIDYAFVAVCDTDCDDVDLRLESPSGREIDSDVERDDVPVVQFRADQSGAYRVVVEMADCDDEPCAYGIGVYATGQDEFERQVQNQLEAATSALHRDGYRLTHEIYTGALREDDSEDIEFELDGGGVYLIIGVCDNDCDDFDLEIMNESGRRIDRDEKTDDVPVVAVSPSRRERFTVRATMASCGDEPCRYGLGVVRQR
jgi:hypothetical protein